MNQSTNDINILTVILLIIIALIIGALISWLISRISSKSLKVQLAERAESHSREIQNYENRLKELRENYTSQLDRHRSEFQRQLESLYEEKDHISIHNQNLILSLSKAESNNENLMSRIEEQRKEVEELQKKFTGEFENLANKILEEKSDKFTQLNKENIKNLLDPLQEKIKSFEDKVEKSEKTNIDLQGQLKEQLRSLQAQSTKISEEAENLTKALKGDSKMQGNWGEVVLERVLEKSGLEKDREFFVQQSFTGEDGRKLIPDVIISLPDNKRMVVDSKVSLTAYEKFVNENEETAKELHKKNHLLSVRNHIKDLSAKNYQDIYKMESPNFVLLFIPIEPAFAVALNADNSLYNYAFDRNIVIVTPTTLLATLRTIDSMWTNQKQQENAFEIARLAGSLYDKFNGFVNDLEGIGKKLDDAKKEYSGAMNKLVDGRGNMVRTIEKLKDMGAKTQKSLPGQLLEKADRGDN